MNKEKKKLIMGSITFVLFLLLYCSAIIYLGNQYDGKRSKFCEGKGGEYSSIYKDCYFEKEGIYQAYNIKKMNDKYILVDRE